MVPVGLRPRKQDLIAAIVSAGELTATGPTVSERTHKDICSSASAAARAPTVSKPAASSSAGVAEQPGLRAEGATCFSFCLRYLFFKSFAHFLRQRPDNFGPSKELPWLEDELRKAFQEHRATTTVGESRAMVGQTEPSPDSHAHRPRNTKHNVASLFPGARGLSRLRRPGRGVAC